MLTNHASGEAAVASDATLDSAQIDLPDDRVATGAAVLRLSRFSELCPQMDEPGETRLACASAGFVGRRERG